MTFTFKITRKDGKQFQHLPIDRRPVTVTVEVRDDDGSVYLFRTNDKYVTARDWYDAEINGRRYTNSDAWHDTPVGYIHETPGSTDAYPIYFGYGGEPEVEDVIRIGNAIRYAILMSAGYATGNLIEEI